MKVIDADAHVEEAEAMWDCLDPEFRHRRPIPITIPEGTSYGPLNATWLIEGESHPKILGPGATFGATPATSVLARSKSFSIGAQELTDVQSRLTDMDNMGIQQQVVFPTLFLGPVSHDNQLEKALCKAYNRFVSQACSRSEGRISFAAVVPWKDTADAIEVVTEAKGLGAVGVMIPGFMWNRPLGHPSLWPFYDALCRQDIPLIIHFGWGAPNINDMCEDVIHGEFVSGAAPVILGFYSLVMTGTLDKFPNLKVALLEAGSGWLPYLVQQMERRYKEGGAFYKAVKRPPSEIVRSGKVYVACEADEDIRYVLEYIGEDQLVMASDYPHEDASHENSMVHALRENPGVNEAILNKILGDNPQRLYNLPN